MPDMPEVRSQGSQVKCVILGFFFIDQKFRILVAFFFTLPVIFAFPVT